MKKLHKILIVVAVALTAAIAGTVVMSDTVGESNAAVQAVEEAGKPVAEARVVDATTGRSSRVESVAIDVNRADFTKEEIMALCVYPRSLDSAMESQSQVADAGLSLPDFTREELEAMYPGYLEWFTASQAQAIDSSSHLPGFTKGEIIALYVYPRSLDSVMESQSRVVDAGLRLPDFTKEELEAMYPGYIEWFTAKQAQTNNYE